MHNRTTVTSQFPASRVATHPKRKRLASSGFSLIEVAVSISILSIVALGLLQAVLLSRKTAEVNVYKNTANTVAYGYIEQVMAMDYDDILECLEDSSKPILFKAVAPSDGSQIFTTTIGDGTTATIDSTGFNIDDPMYFNRLNQKDIIIDIRTRDGEKRVITMPMRFTLTGFDINTGARPYHALEITMEFEFQMPGAIDDEQFWIKDELSFVKSIIPIY